MIFILVPPVFCIRRAALASLVMRMRNKKLPHLQHADEQWRFFLTSVEVSVELLLIPGAYRAAKRRGSMQFRILPIHTAKFDGTLK